MKLSNLIAGWRALLIIPVLTLTACGGSNPGTAASNGMTCNPADAGTAGACGSIALALTDAEGDFASYTVDVLAISLQRADGSTVELLPQASRIDFAQLTSLSELMSVTTVAPGEFVSGHIQLDYTDAEIFVEADGDIVPARVFDTAGVELTTDTGAGVVDVEVQLANADRLLVTRGAVAFLSIDFDLAASHAVDTATNPATAVAQPWLIAETRPLDAKEMRLRGALVDVNVAAGSYTVDVRPWHDRNGRFGRFTVHTDDLTQFEINGDSHTGTDGLAVLALLSEGSLTVAFGTLDPANRRLNASVVHAGDSVYGNRLTAILGNIVSRTNDRLVLKGTLAIRHDRRAHFQRTVVVDIGPDTGVTKTGFPNAIMDKDDLSVGQRVAVFGELANPDLETSDRFGPDIALVMDATHGRARMLVTRLTGALNDAMPGQIGIRLRSIDRLSASMFDFSGTGITPDLDADPANYRIATSTLPLAELAIDEPVRVLGFVTPFGAAPPDFEGTTLIGPRDLPATLGVGWGISGTGAPFSSMGPANLVIELANPDIGSRHHMRVGDRLIDLYELPASPGITESDRRSLYGITEPGHVELFANFADFVDELSLRLSHTDRARSLAAYGNYSSGDHALTARKIVVHMLPAD